MSGMSWPKNSFRFFCMMLWKNPNELFGQSDSISTQKKLLDGDDDTIIIIVISFNYCYCC